MSNAGIYLIVSPANRYYVGQTKDLSKRYADYKAGGSKNQRRLYRSIKKYGFEKHSFDVLLRCSVAELNAWEAFYIKMFDTFDTDHGLNLRSGGGVSVMSKETIQRMRAAQKGRVVSDETRQKLSVSISGNKVKEDVKLQISKMLTGKPKSRQHVYNQTQARIANGSMKKITDALAESKKKPVLDTATGIIYNSAKEAYKLSGYSYSNFTSKLRNAKPNNTTFCFV